MSTFANYNFKGQRALVRVDFNVPLDDKFQITDDTRMRAAVPTIKKILGDGGSVILMSHLGRPKGGPEDKFSLRHLLPHLKELLPGTPVEFADDCIGESAVNAASALKPGTVLLLENLRFYKEEEKGDKAFAEKLSKLGDVYVNDAFGTAHRAHASTAVIAQFFPKDKRMFGLLMEAEVNSANKVLKDTQRPFTAILGGAKVSDKILIIENLLDRANNLIIGGGMAYTFLKAQGHPIGKSLCEEDKLDLANEILVKAKAKGVQLLIPVDSVVADKFAPDAATKEVSNDNIPDGWMGLDIGPKTIEAFGKVILASRTILWNGPMGVFEMEKFQQGTKAVAELVAKATAAGAFSLVGGGDSVAAVNQFGLADKVSYVSTGGGALLEFFEGKVLPGIAAVTE
ncbi:MAG TPA: phosphoglycerate kinase [Dinghuibacter sp.]|jgi:phosphoglycerate kinase|uniref:phosphoglycerate kinase n=1 Tax=Dinghuibacter sp. TaxID=2024697 RepID=UPI002B71B561|nr:phosphoglycerate kinase [Dinghuibacter sp.]HTJ10565.1 phosphoglycerate kinase [Dinghuibacter sp.]